MAHKGDRNLLMLVSSNEIRGKRLVRVAHLADWAQSVQMDLMKMIMRMEFQMRKIL